MSNIATVQSIYAAFGRGDIPAILQHLAEDVVWEDDKSEAVVPWLVPRKGRSDVPQFFEALAALDFQKFEPRTLLESGNTVVSLNDVAFTVRSTGKSVVEEDEVHIWNFGPDGRVTRFRHKTDTHRHWLAIQAS